MGSFQNSWSGKLRFFRKRRGAVSYFYSEDVAPAFFYKGGNMSNYSVSIVYC
jgi:hypothetical protein